MDNKKVTVQGVNYPVPADEVEQMVDESKRKIGLSHKIRSTEKLTTEKKPKKKMSFPPLNTKSKSSHTLLKRKRTVSQNQIFQAVKNSLNTKSKSSHDSLKGTLSQSKSDNPKPDIPKTNTSEETTSTVRSSQKKSQNEMKEKLDGGNVTLINTFLLKYRRSKELQTA
ncbi:hypothetical protein FF38_06855 [Lucilia cuprina]|uniref:Uncharacterized protein n=1 Tax=Lucilia cuprina TaxID=7375 RepID=A0A0L0CMR9_LUCCU|nr:hypothetical protein FF38_06855 [Lucilia cuprina]